MGAEEPEVCAGPQDKPALFVYITKSVPGSAYQQVESVALQTDLQVKIYLSAVPTC